MIKKSYKKCELHLDSTLFAYLENAVYNIWNRFLVLFAYVVHASLCIFVVWN